MSILLQEDPHDDELELHQEPSPWIGRLLVITLVVIGVVCLLAVS